MKTSQPRAPRWTRWALALVGVLAALSAAGWAASHWPLPAAPSSVGSNEPSSTALPAVGAWGRIAPRGEVIDLGAPTGMDGVRVQRLLVEEGDVVRAGDVVAVLDTYDRRQVAVREAEAQVAVAVARLAQAREGAKPEELAAQEATIARCRVELENAEQQFDRGESLAKKNVISAEDQSSRALLRDRAREALRQAESQFAALKAVRPVDVALAEQQWLQAKTAVDRAQAELAAARILAPADGQVLKVHARPGQRILEKGVVEMGDTRTMYAIAEVYEADIARVRIGQSASLRVPSLQQELHGTVERLGFMVGRKGTLNNDPIADTDARVVEVRIRIADAEAPRVAALSNARVQIRIDVLSPEKGSLNDSGGRNAGADAMRD